MFGLCLWEIEISHVCKILAVFVAIFGTLIDLTVLFS